jgi:hypothetical protein
MCNARCRRGKKEGCRVITRGNVFAREPTNHVPVIYQSTVGYGVGCQIRGGWGGGEIGWARCGEEGEEITKDSQETFFLDFSSNDVE